MKIFLNIIFQLSGVFFAIKYGDNLIESFLILLSIIAGIILLLKMKSNLDFRLIINNFIYSKISITHGWIILVIVILIFKNNLNFMMYLYAPLFILMKIILNHDSK